MIEEYIKDMLYFLWLWKKFKKYLRGRATYFRRQMFRQRLGWERTCHSRAHRRANRTKGKIKPLAGPLRPRLDRHHPTLRARCRPRGDSSALLQRRNVRSWSALHTHPVALSSGSSRSSLSSTFDLFMERQHDRRRCVASTSPDIFVLFWFYTTYMSTLSMTMVVLTI